MYYVEPPVLKKPENENAKIWRYMDFTKFMDILERRSLYFTRSDKFEDPFEGISSKVTKEERLQYINDIGKQCGSIIKDAFLSSSEHLDRKVREWTAINCWHMNEYESDAMWKLYLKSNEGIAVQSTYKRLNNSFSDLEEKVCIGQVNYIDYELDNMQYKDNMLAPFLHKRKSFEHERELRAIMMKIPKKGERYDYDGEAFEHGTYVQVNLDELIDKIYVAPTAPQWVVELVELVLNKYKLEHKKVIQSSLFVKPTF